MRGSHSQIAFALVLGAGFLARADVASAQPKAKVDALGDPLPPGAVARLGTTRFRPGGGISRLVFSPGGKRLACWSDTGLSVYDAATGRELRHVALTEPRCVALTWLKDGRGLAVLQLGDQSFYTWDFTDTKADPPRIPLPRGWSFTPSLDYERYSAIAVSPDGKHLAAGRLGRHKKSRTIDLLELTAGKRVSELKLVRTFGPQPGNCTGLAFAHDQRTLLVFSRERGADEERLVLYDPATGEARKRMTVPASEVRSIPDEVQLPLHSGLDKLFALAPDGRTVELGMWDGTVRVWDVVLGKETRTVARHVKEVGGKVEEKGILGVAFGAGGRTLITSGRDSLACLWDAGTGKKIRGLGRDLGLVFALAVSADGKRIATGGSEDQVRVWDADTGAEACPVAGYGEVGWTTELAPGERTAASVGMDGTIHLWEVDTGRPIRRIDREKARAFQLIFRPDGKALLVGDGQGRAKTQLFDTDTGKPLPLPAALAAERGRPLGLTPDRRTLLMAHQGVVTLWDWPSGRPRRKFSLGGERPQPDPRAYCQGASLSADGRLLLTAGAGDTSSGGAVELWDANTGRRLRHVSYPGYSTPSPRFSPDGHSFLMVGSGINFSNPVVGEPQPLPGDISLWDRVRFRKVHDFLPPPLVNSTWSPQIGPVAFSPDGRTLAVGVGGQPVSLYEVATGEVRRQLVGHRAYIQSLAFTHEGRRVLSTSRDRTGLVWDVGLTATGTPATPANAAAREQLWKDLAGAKAKPAYAAMARLATTPDATVALIRARLRPATYPNAVTLDRLLADLDDQAFAVRDRASAELDRLGGAVVPGTLARLGKAGSLEQRRRLELFLDKHDRGVPSGERLREGRAVELLEHVGSAEARAVLRELAGGVPTVRLTRDSAAALHRLEGRKP